MGRPPEAMINRRYSTCDPLLSDNVLLSRLTVSTLTPEISLNCGSSWLCQKNSLFSGMERFINWGRSTVVAHFTLGIDKGYGFSLKRPAIAQCRLQAGNAAADYYAIHCQTPLIVIIHMTVKLQ